MKKIGFLLFFGLFIFSSCDAQEQPEEVTKGLKVGDKAPEISLQTINDEPFLLSSLKGKIVLIDFWASWCQPCIKEQPELIELYSDINSKYPNANFEILGVSLDRDKEDWEKAVNKFEIPWLQVSDLKFWRSQVAEDYFLEGIPYNLIIDKDGKIIAVDLHGDELSNFIEKTVK